MKNKKIKKNIKIENKKWENIIYLRRQLTNQLSDIINKYYSQILAEKSNGLPSLKPIDIIAVLELLKLNFYCEYTRIILQEMNKTEDIPIVKSKEKR
jgi:hypothetical protein